MTDDLVNAMVPVLGRSLDPQFNVFDVMHHGLHEKKISNVFRWLLNADGTHGLGDRFVRVFIEAVNESTDPGLDLDDRYWVRQEVNTSSDPTAPDIADLVLESEASVIVVENYFTSDGHGHSYDGYLAVSQREDKRGRVVLLCREANGYLLTQGWEGAAVVTHGQVIARLHDQLSADKKYRRDHVEANAFIEQIHRKFTEGVGAVDESNALDFVVVAMCSTGETRRYQIGSMDAAQEQLAADLAAQGRERFGEGRELLQQAKGLLRGFGAKVVQPQVNAVMGEGTVRGVSANRKSIYQWTIDFETPGLAVSGQESFLKIKFGPPAWAAISYEEKWKTKPLEIDYRHLFVCRSGVGIIRQSSVTLDEVLAGLDPDDTRLRDELVALARV